MSLVNRLLGRPLAMEEEKAERIGPAKGIPCAPVLFRTKVLRLPKFPRRFDDRAMKAAGVFFVALATMCAQVPNPTQQQPALTPAETGQPTPIFTVTVVSRTISAINYHHRSGTTQIDFRGTELLPPARGEARVESQMGSTKIDVHVNHLTPANQFGPECLTYVLWAITPKGRGV